MRFFLLLLLAAPVAAPHRKNKNKNSLRVLLFTDERLGLPDGPMIPFKSIKRVHFSKRPWDISFSMDVCEKSESETIPGVTWHFSAIDNKAWPKLELLLASKNIPITVRRTGDRCSTVSTAAPAGGGGQQQQRLSPSEEEKEDQNADIFPLRALLDGGESHHVDITLVGTEGLGWDDGSVMTWKSIDSVRLSLGYSSFSMDVRAKSVSESEEPGVTWHFSAIDNGAWAKLVGLLESKDIAMSGRRTGGGWSTVS